ncbi:MAG: UPF0182 family protein [Armatimonadota bacterium]|nr:UPF0182 family protein [bacterium]
MSTLHKYFWPAVVALLLLLMIFGGALVGLYTDWLWFKDLGYGGIFSKILLTKVGLGVVLGLLFFFVIYGNLWYARKIAPPPSPMGLEQRLLERLGRLARRGIGLVLFGGSIVISVLVGLEAATHWEDWLKFVHSTPFGATDPQFGMDIGFYVFRLPFLNYIYNWLFVALAISTIAAIAIHYADEAIEVFGNRVQFAPGVKAHLGTLVALMFFLKAWGYRLGMYQLVLGSGNLFDGASYADVHARLYALWILFFVAIIGGLLVLFNITRRGLGFATVGLGLVVGMSILAGSIYPALVEQLNVKPNELEKEMPFIKRAITATQNAYGLDQIAVRPFAAETSLTAAQVEANETTIQNVRLWDQDHLQSAYNQVQTINQYYHFQDVDVDRYWLADKASGEKRYRQVWLSAREFDQEQLASNAQTWINLHLQYTHGYGFCMSPVNEVNDEGMPTFFVSDIPPKTTVDLPLDQMGVYFGEVTRNYVFVDTNAKEFDYPAGAGTVETTYSGDEGIGIGGFFRKVLFALRFQDLNILLNQNLKSKSKVLYNREVENRVRTLFSFLQFDSDPYLVTAGGGLYWMWDGYTITDAYPYSQRSPSDATSFNYIRNSVKIVVNAYTGKVDAYSIQEPLDDPIIKTYQKMFPGAFKPISRMPAQLREHIRYPEDLFRIQTNIYRRYHQTNPTVFYNNSDLWEVASRADLTGGGGEEGSPMEPYYVIMKLPNGESEEFILMTPFIRAGKFNMVSWMCAKCDAADYGRLVLYQFPRDKNVYGPQQVAARARQDTVISQQVTLWSQQGSQVSSGNLLVVPIESSLMYVMPVYLESTSTKIPELKRVIVALGNKVAMQPTLAEALSDVVGAPVTTPESVAKPKAGVGKPSPVVPGAVASESVKRLIDQAVSQYNAAQDAQKRGDWSQYGVQVKALQKTLNELKAKAR